MVVATILAAIFSFTVISERRSTNAATLTSSSLQLADAASERARANIVNVYRDSYLSSDKFVERLKDGSLETAFLSRLGGSDGSGEGGINSFSLGDSQANWRFVVPDVEVPDKDEENTVDFSTDPKWLDIYATAKTGEGVQTVVRRINMGQSDVFTLAMLSENTECIYCHLRVFGDVGSLGFLRPGFGNEDSGVGDGAGGDGGGSVIHGELFITPPKEGALGVNNMSDDSGNPNEGEINGAVFEGVNDNYTGSRLPTDSEGNPDFPVINRLTAARSADGKISGGIIATVGGSEELTAAPVSGSTTLSGATDGNVVLIGTKDDPIKLEGDVYFSGDVVIKGYVEGRGGVYAGRNVYIAGDVKYSNEPEDCRLELTEGGDPDECAQNSIADEADELRIAARGNVVMGDYTRNDNGVPKTSYQSLNASDYFRDQFGFGEGNTPFYYDTVTGDELYEEDGVFYNVDGNPVTTVSAPIPPKQAYDYSLSPGRIAGGVFDSWLSDDVYQDILGTQVRAYDTWRQSVSRDEMGEIYDTAKREGRDPVEAVRAVMGPGARDVSAASLERLVCRNSASACPDKEGFDLLDENDQPVGFVNWNLDGAEEDKPTLRVTLDKPAEYEAQTNRVDAFLYANQRIAGKTFNAPLVINGGMVAKEIGVLAPGAQQQWWQPPLAWETAEDFKSDYAFLSGTDKNCNALDSNILGRLAPNSFIDEDGNLQTLVAGSSYPNGNGYYDVGLSDNHDYSEDCALTVNYDYRMRNGGLGFNLVSQDVGRTVSWRVGATKDDRVGF